MDVATLERRLRRVPGIEAVRVVMNGASASEVHVLALPGKPPKQVVRDVQSVAMAAYGLSIDRRVVSVVQMHSDLRDGGDRPAIDDIAEETTGSRAKLTVTLTWRDQRLEGTAVGPSARATRLALVADATVAALEQGLAGDAAFAVTGIDVHQVGGARVAVAAVALVSGGEERIVSGSALVREDELKSAARAVLDALNRQFPTIVRE